MLNKILQLFMPVLKALGSIVPKQLVDIVLKRPTKEGFINIYDSIAKRSFQMYWRTDFYVERPIYQHGLYGNWEKESLKIWAHLSKKSKVIIDVGANTGVYSLLAKNNNAQATVIAVEPVDINYAFLMDNIKQNQFDIKVEKIALSDKEGTGEMFMLKDTLNYMTSVNDNRYALHPEVQQNKEVVKIDIQIKPYSYVHNHYSLAGLDLVKIDVEGHEMAVLKGMRTYIEQYKPSILIEIIGDENAKELDVFFRQFGYTYVSIDEKKESVEVDKLWDNNHCNFLICTQDTVKYLKSVSLIE